MAEQIFNPALPDPATPVAIDPPVKKVQPTYEEAMAAGKNYAATKNPFYGTNVLTGTRVDYAPTKKYLDQAYGFSPNRDNEDFYAQRQGVGGDLVDLVSAVGLKLPALTATKVIGGLGYVSALLNPVNWTSEEGFIGSAADNAISKWADSAEDSIKNEFLPTFQEASDVNKGFFRRAFTDLDFWTSDVVDGAAFMASAFIPGMALSKLGVGAKLAQGLSRFRMGANAAGEVVNGLEVAQRYLGSAEKIAKSFDAVTTWALATTSEAMYEAADVRKNVLNSLDRKTNPETGTEYTEEEKRAIAGGAAKNTFLLNTALLGATNAIQMKYLYKTLGIAESTVGRVAARAGEEGFERVVAKTKWGKFLDSRYGAFSKGVAVGTLSEGYVEENVQLAIQRMNQEFGSAGKVAGVRDYFDVANRSIKQIKEAITGDDPEAAMSIGLGALLGGVMGGIGDARQRGRDRITTDQAVARLNDSQRSWLKFGSLYETTEEDVVGTDGKPTGEKTVKLKLDAQNQPIINEAKLADILTDFNSNANMNELADKLKDKNQAKFLRDLSFRNFVQAHIEGGIEDTLIEKLDQASRATPEALAKMGFDPTQAIDINQYRSLANQIIAQNNLIKNSILRTGSPQEEGARIGTLVGLADQQAILNGIVTDISKDSEAIKSKLVTPEVSSLSDVGVDSINGIQYRIDAQKAYIESLEAQSGVKTKLKVARQLLAELNKAKTKFKTDNYLSLEGAIEKENGYYDYQNPARSASPLNIAFQKSLLEKAQYQNSARSMGLEFALYADTKNGLKNFKDFLTEEVVNPINQRDQEEEVKEVLEAENPQLDPGDPRINDVNERRDNSIQELHELYEGGDAGSSFTVGLDKDGVTIVNNETFVETKLEDVVPGQYPDALIEQLTEVQKRIDQINKDADQEIQNLAKAIPAPPTSEVPNPAVASNENLKDFYVFDNKSVKANQVYTENSTGEKWRVRSTIPDQSGPQPRINIELLDKNDVPTGRRTNITSLDGYTLSGFIDEATNNIIPIEPAVATVNTNAADKFKIKRENELIRIYPYQETLAGKRESIPAAQRKLDNLLKNTSKEDLANGITMTVTKAAPGSPSLAGTVIGNPNGNLEVNPDSLTVQLELNGNPIGFVTNYTHYSVRDKSGKNVPIEKLTVAQFSEIFDTTGKDPKVALEAFKQNFLKGRRLFKVLSNLLGNKGTVSVSNEQLNNMIALNVSTGQFDFVDETKAATLDELSYNTINGHTYVIDRVRTYQKGKFVTKPLAITTATGAERRQIEREIKESKAQGRDLTEQLGRYVAVVKMPNGILRFVELTTDKWTADNLESLTDQINERSRLSKENNLTDKTDEESFNISTTTGKSRKTTYVGGKDETYNDVLNDEIARTLFLALPKKNRGTYIDFYVNAMGNLQLKINIPMGSKTIKHSIIVKQEDNEKPLNFKNIDDLISRVNKAIIDYNKTARDLEQTVTVTLTRDNFKISLPSTAGVTEIRGMRTTVSTDMVKDISLTYTPKETIDSVIPAKTEPDPGVTVTKQGGKNYELDPVKRAEFLAAYNGTGAVDQNMLNELFGTGTADSAQEQERERILAITDPEDRKAAEITFVMNALFSQVGEAAATKIREYADRIINGESRESVIQGLPPTFVTGIDDMITVLQSPGPSIDVTLDPLQSRPVTQTGSFKELSDEIKANQMEYIRTKAAELQAQGIGKGAATIQATKEARVIYGKQLDDLKLKLGRQNGSALKVVNPDKFDQASVENIDRFRGWVKDNLPDFISVQEVNNLADNLSNKNITAGMFVSYMQQLQDGNKTIKGRIRVGDNTPFKYHEAFHAVFRLLSTDKQISQLLEISKREVKADLKKQGITLNKALEDFRALHPIYDTLTPTELEERFYEEHLADRFDDWKTNKRVETSHVAKGLFARIMDWIRRLFGAGVFPSELESLFGDIDNGKYRNSNIKDNMFTREESLMITEPALKVIKVGTDIVQDENGNDIIIDRYLSQQEGDQLAASITSVFYDRLGQAEQYNKKQLLNEILDEYKDLYNVEREDGYYSSEVDRLFPDDSQQDDMINYLNRLTDRYTVFSEQENRQSLLEAVDVHLRLMGFKQELDSDEFDTTVDDYGDRVTTDNWKETHSIGGFGSLSQFLRQYIATTTFEYVDEFGNNQLKEGVPLLQAVNANLVYNGMLKAVANIGDQNVVMNRLKLLQSPDTETGKFITKFFNDAGIVFHEDGTWEATNTNRARLVQQVLKGFNQYSVDYIFLNKDIRENEQITHTMVANRRDSGKTQFSIWQNAYVRVFEDQVVKIKDRDKKAEFYDNRVEPLQDLYTLMETNTAISDANLELEAKAISNLLKDNIGISLDPSFIKFSILSNKDRTLLTENQTTLLDAYAETYFITRDDVSQIIRSIQSGENPFAKNLDDEDSQVEEQEEGEGRNVEKSINDLGKGGVVTRINNLAKGNSAFDETVYSSSWKNADGELVYTHQLPTYHLVRIQQLNDDSYLDELRQDPFLENNFLLNSDKFAVIQGNLKVSRVDGAKSSILSKTEEGVREDKTITANKNKGITYGSFSDREFLTTLFDLYAFGKDYKNEDGTFRTSQHLIRVLEASNTGDTIGLPIVKAVDLDKSGNVILTEGAVNQLVAEVTNEFERIRRVQAQIDSITTETGGFIDQIDGYHYGTNKSTGQRDYSKGRGLQLYKTGLMMGDLKAELEQLALDPTFNISSKTGDIKNQIKDYWKDQIAEILGLMTDSGVLTKNQVDLEAGEKQTYKNNLIDKYIETGFVIREGSKEQDDDRRNSLLNIIPGNIEHNVAQVLVNDYINTLSLNQLLLGDQAQSLKDSVDEVKRARGANASGPSLESNVLAPQVGITAPFTESYILQFEDPLYRSKYTGNTGEKADAQMWGTTKSMRNVLHGLGKLDPFTAKMLDKIEQGKSLTSKEVFDQGGLKDLHQMFNSMKLVYYDGKMYIKTSFVMLTKELTSYNDNGTWKPLPGKEELHDLRERLEKFELDHDTVTFAVPKSASKGLKVNISASAKEAQDHNFQPQETKFWRLQLENPSNKLSITDPTQAKQLILAEQNDETQVDFLGTTVTVGSLKKMYLADTAQRVKNNYKTARNEIFNIEGAFEELSASIDLGKVTPKLAKFQARAVDSLRSSGADSQTIEFFELGKNGEPKYNLNNPITLDKYTQLFLAYFSKGVMSEKVPGHSVALMSNYGYKMVKQVVELDPTTNQPTRWNLIRTAEFKQDPGLYSGAQRWNNDLDREFTGLKVGDYYVDDLRHNVPEYNEKGELIGHFSEFVMPPHFAELLDLKPGDKIPEAVQKAFGVRIPSQDKHSTITLKMVDIMPAFYGSTAIFPHELIEISGADFDIDKLYMHIADVYRKDGQLVAYGTAVTPEERFDEYLEYMRTNNKDFKSAVKELKQDVNNTTLDDELEPGEAVGLLEDALRMQSVSDNMILYKEALRMLGLPDSPQAYVDYVAKNGEQNNGVLNNRILSQKIGLVSNTYMIAEQPNGAAPIAFEVASVDPLKNIVDQLVREFADPLSDNYVKEIADIVSENPTDTDSLLGKYKAFKNNKEGSRNIGPAVNSILAYSIMSTFNVNLRDRYLTGVTETIDDFGKKHTTPNWGSMYLFKLNGHTFNSYSPVDKKGKQSLKAYNPITKEYDGDRIFGSISTVVSAMTDNAKERLAARLGLNIEAIGYLTNMLAQGVPMSSAIRFLLQPAIREYFSEIKIASNKIKTGKEQQIRKGEVLNSLLSSYRDKAGEQDVEPLDLTDELLDEGLSTNGADPLLQYSILVNFNGLKKQSEFFSKVASVLKLTKGLGTSFEGLASIQQNIAELGLRMGNVDFERTTVPFDLRQVFMGTDPSKPYHEFMNNYIKTGDQIDHMSQSMFIEKTPVFQRISDIVKANLEVRGSNIKEFNTTLKRDLISYLSIKSYMKTLKDEGRTRTLKTLDNAMIYDESAKLKGEDFNDIIDTFKEIRTKLPDNYFASKFVNIISTQRVSNDGELGMNEVNRDGINKAEANTWAKLSEYQLEKIKDSFLEIYQNDDTREHAVDIFNYLLVKDAGQFKSNSFIRMIPTFMFDSLLKSTAVVNDTLKLSLDSKTRTEVDKRYTDVFGVTSTELFNEFMKSYTSHIGNEFQVRKLYQRAPEFEATMDKEVANFKPQSFVITGGVQKADTEEKVDPLELLFGKKPTKKEEAPKVDLTPGITIDIFAGIRKGKEAFDTGTTQGIIEVKKVGKFSQRENDMLNKNKELLRSKGFTDFGGEFNFPYVIVNSNQQGKRTYYKLVSVERRVSKGIKIGKTNKAEDVTEVSTPSSLILPGEYMARGYKARYEEYTPIGSRKSTLIGELFGPIPIVPKKPRTRKQYGAVENTGKYSSMSASDIAERMGLSEPVVEVEKSTTFANPNLSPADILVKKYGITTKVTNKQFTFKGELWDTFPKDKQDLIRTPTDLLTALGYNMTDTSEPITYTSAPLPDTYQEVPLPGQTLEDTVEASEMTEEDPSDSFTSRMEGGIDIGMRDFLFGSLGSKDNPLNDECAN